MEEDLEGQNMDTVKTEKNPYYVLQFPVSVRSMGTIQRFAQRRGVDIGTLIGQCIQDMIMIENHRAGGSRMAMIEPNGHLLVFDFGYPIPDFRDTEPPNEFEWGLE